MHIELQILIPISFYLLLIYSCKSIGIKDVIVCFDYSQAISSNTLPILSAFEFAGGARSDVYKKRSDSGACTRATQQQTANSNALSIDR